ncbi:MAG: hypothetical protein ACREJO_10135 [Phycisphaerales bacterium]
MIVAVGVAAAACAARPALGQGDREPVAIEVYLERQGLKTLLAEHLAQKLKTATGEERAKLAERLGKIYVDLMGSAQTAEERESWFERGQQLLKLVPESQQAELRLDMARRAYARAEELAELHRLRLADGAQRAEAEKILRQIKPQLETLATELSKRADAAERASTANDDAKDTQAEDARRLRSVAWYYAGWTNYYLALVSNSDTSLNDALKAFGHILGHNASGYPTRDKINKAQLRYDHIARAAIGTALVYGKRGQDDDAMWWLTQVEESPDAPGDVKQQLLARRISVLAGAKRWANLFTEVDRARKAGITSEALPVNVARLLAVVTLDALIDTRDDTLTRLSQIALQDLVERRQLGHVLDLTGRYGTQLLGEKGFIVLYVRGAQEYEHAIEAQRKAGENVDEPSGEAAVVNAYMQASRLLDHATEQEDAQHFAAEKSRALQLSGRALYHAGQLREAADRFSKAAEIARVAKADADAQESLWLAIVALDKLVRKTGEAQAASNVTERLEELTTLFVKQHPGTERAAQLMIRQTASGKVSDEEAIKTLLAVSKDSPVYESSRRQAARLLYRRFRSATADDRAFLAARFVTVAEELLLQDRRAALTESGADGEAAGERVVVDVRQLLDAMLSVPAPDITRAEGVLGVLDQVAAHRTLDLSKIQDELDFRRFQLLLAKDDQPAAERIADGFTKRLNEPGGEGARRYAVSASRVLYQRSVQLWQRAEQAKQPPADVLAAARRVVKQGGAVIEQLGAEKAAMNDPAVATAYLTVARAAARVWELGQDSAARDLAIKLDKAVLAASPNLTEPLLRLAELSEAAGDMSTAVECWRLLSSGLEPGTPEWYRARYNHMRVLIHTDPPLAEQSLKQHALLYPNFGPEPWGSKLRELYKQIVPEPVPTNQGGTP